MPNGYRRAVQNNQWLMNKIANDLAHDDVWSFSTAGCVEVTAYRTSFETIRYAGPGAGVRPSEYIGTADDPKPRKLKPCTARDRAAHLPQPRPADTRPRDRFVRIGPKPRIEDPRVMDELLFIVGDS